ncbi:MAG: DinB family protein, partial [Actinomycetota bacterium]
MPDLRTEVLAVVEESYDNRLAPRLEGLTDEEYLWEPVPDCWSIRPAGDGTYRGDWGFVFDEIPPFTTIAWRMSHLIDVYGSRRLPRWLGIDAKPSPLDAGFPGTADAAKRMLADAHELFLGYVSAVEESELWSKIGPVGGQYAEGTKLSIVMHQLDEVVHHGAEIALLRDLYRAQHLNDDPFVLAALVADREAIDEMRRKDTGIIEAMIAAHPNLMLRAAETGRWDAIPLLVELGFPVNGTNGRGPVHHA